jgi:hypothetical protein
MTRTTNWMRVGVGSDVMAGNGASLKTGLTRLVGPDVVDRKAKEEGGLDSQRQRAGTPFRATPGPSRPATNSRYETPVPAWPPAH